MGWFKDKKFKFCRGSLKNLIFRVHEKPIYRGELPKKWGGLKKKNGGAVFKEGS